MDQLVCVLCCFLLHNIASVSLMLVIEISTDALYARGARWFFSPISSLGHVDVFGDHVHVDSWHCFRVRTKRSLSPMRYPTKPRPQVRRVCAH